MGKLSHIEDIEARNAAQAEPVQQAVAAEPAQAAAQEATQASLRAVEQAPAADADAEKAARASAARAEEDFHGLNSTESLGSGHTVLVVAAVVVFAAAVLWVLNYWFHFI